MRPTYLFIVIIFSFLQSCQEKEDLPSITLFSTSDGLPSDVVYCITEDNFGNIWIGTENGIGKYNGLQWQIYLDTIQLNTNRVTNIVNDNSGNIWFEYFNDYNNLSRFNGLTLETINDFGELYKDLDSNVNYYYYDRKIFKYGDNGFKEIDIPLIYDDHCFVNQVLLDSKGYFWVSMDDYCLKGVTKFDGNKWTDYETDSIFKNSDIGNSIYGIIESKNGKILFAAGTSIIQYDGNNWSILLDTYKKYGKPIFSYVLFEDSKGNIWFGLDNLYKFNGSKIQLIDLNKYPQQGQYGRIIKTFFEDSKGNIWVGTGDGIFEIK